MRSPLRAPRQRRRRCAARLPERVPAPRERAVQRLGQRPDRDPLRLSPVVLGPRGPAARGAVATRLRRHQQRRVRLAVGAGRHLGRARVRQPRPERRAARGVPRARPRRDGVAAPRRVHVPGDRHRRVAVQLEVGDRRVQRDVSRAGDPPTDDPVHRRRQRAAGGVGAPRAPQPAVRDREPPAPQRCIRPADLGVVLRDAGGTRREVGPRGPRAGPGSPRPTNRCARCWRA